MSMSPLAAPNVKKDGHVQAITSDLLHRSVVRICQGVNLEGIRD